MKMTLALQHEDLQGETPVPVLVTTADLVAFERFYDAPALAALPFLQDAGDDNTSIITQARLEHMAFLAWSSCKRSKRTTKDFDEWIEGLVGFGSDDDEDADDDAGNAKPAKPAARKRASKSTAGGGEASGNAGTASGGS